LRGIAAEKYFYAKRNMAAKRHKKKISELAISMGYNE
jgi:hypothetical protein